MSRRVPATALRRRPTVSVIVPCYNYGNYLTLAVNSVLEQPDVELDVLLIDDASPDGSAAVGAALAARDPRVRFIGHEHNRGHIATFNEGLDMVDGDYVVLLSADDALAPGALGRAAALLDEFPSVGFVYGYPDLFVDSQPSAATAVRSWTVWSGREWFEGRFRSGRNCILCPEVMMRRSVQQAIGGFDPLHPHAGDLQMWLRAAVVADVGRINGATQGFYRVHDKSMQRTVYASHLRDLEERHQAFASVAARSSGTIANCEELLGQACRALAVSALDHVCRLYDDGETDTEPIDEYLDFARRMWEPATRSSAWRAVERRRRLGPERAQRGVVVAGHRVRRDVSNHLRWRRWRWSGV